MSRLFLITSESFAYTIFHPQNTLHPVVHDIPP